MGLNLKYAYIIEEEKTLGLITDHQIGPYSTKPAYARLLSCFTFPSLVRSSS